MKAKLLALLPQIKALVQKAVALAPLPAGIAIGYLGHPVIKLAVDAASHALRALLG